MRRVLLTLPLLAFACNSGGNSGGNTGGLAAQSQALLSMLVSAGEGAQEALPTFLVPAVATAKGITITPGAAPDSYTFHIPIDTDGDGTNDASIDGSVTLNGGLFTFGPGFGGTATVNVTFGGQMIAAMLTFNIAANGDLELSGTGTLTDVATTAMVTFEIDSANPLLITLVTQAPAIAGLEAPSFVGNLCNFSGQGNIRVSSYADTMLYSALWTLSFDQIPISVTEASIMDGEVETPQPDSSFVVAPCPMPSIQDWAGTWDFDWVCNPEESGQSVLEITVTGPNSIHIVDGDLEYDATAVNGNPHAVQGSFVDGDSYEEFFIWTLTPDGNTFTQDSAYFNLPPSSGGGLCGGIGIKRP